MDGTRFGLGSEGQHPDRKCPSPAKRHAVKRHHHKHNLKHRYDFRETLGKGTYGKVQRAVDRTGKPVAIKSIKKENIKDEQDLTHIRREIEIMSSLNHPYITTIYEVFENKDKIVIVMEYASRGDLFDYISDRRITEREARHIFRQIVSAVHYCHRNGIVHRDLKLENILLDANGDVKIADFGLSNLYQRDEYLQTYCGSPLYASPEIVNGRPYRGPEVDSWSLGVLLYALVHEAMPFEGHDYRTLVRQISTGDYRKPNKPSDACGLIRWMLMVNPDRRATLEEIAGHWWLNWGYQRPLLAENETAAAATTSASSQMSNSARITDWLRRTSRPLLHSGSKMRCLLRPGGGVTGDHTSITRQRSIRRSRKENNVSQSMQENTAPRPFKGILKKRGSLKQKPCGEAQVPPLEEITTNAVVAPSATQSSAPPPAPPPRKGILKKPVERERESGYSSSTEGSDSTQTPQPELCSVVPPRHKGILKRNGKFSSGGLQEFGEFGSLDQLAASLPTGGIRSRPSIAISEDSILSSESFDRLDLPDRREPALKVERPAGGPMRSSVSADNLLDMKESRQELWDTEKTGESKFSSTDCET